MASFALAERAAQARDVMTVAFGLDPAEASQREEIFRGHAQRPGIISLGAFDDKDRLVAFCYGFPGLPSSWWESQIRPHLVQAGTEEWLSNVFELTELHVHPDRQGRGIGRALITCVCNASNLPKAILSVRSDSAVAQRLYRSLGFTDLTAPFTFGNLPPEYLVMGAWLPLPTSRRHR
ncbi:MAG TPA: GNAT family N-acetyltransferase [Micromonosporaceae bacterium]|nr:GNAT family N-acetyltransferase [Micromonosporaceae bacterium]